MGFFSDFFYYTRIERRAVLLLAVLIAGLIVAQWVIPRVVQPSTYDLSAFRARLAADSLLPESPVSLPTLQPFDPNTVSRSELLAMGLPEATVRAWLAYRSKGGRFDGPQDLIDFRRLSVPDRERILAFAQFSTAVRPAVATPTTHEVFPFNPNTVRAVDLRRMGLSDRTVRAWMNYRSKGGYFKDAAGVAAFRALPREDFARLETYLLFDEVAPTQPAAVVETSVSEPIAAAATVPIDINTATADEWQSLRGIGPAYSRRIVKFRGALGGFYRIGQVADTYGLPDSVFQAILPYLTLADFEPNLAINRADAATLAQHPYLDRRTARLLVAYREQHGPYRNSDDLRKARVPDATVLDRIDPYLVFD